MIKRVLANRQGQEKMHELVQIGGCIGVLSVNIPNGFMQLVSVNEKDEYKIGNLKKMFQPFEQGDGESG